MLWTKQRLGQENHKKIHQGFMPRAIAVLNIYLVVVASKKIFFLHCQVPTPKTTVHLKANTLETKLSSIQ